MTNKKVQELRELSIPELLKMRSDILSNIRTIRFKSRVEKSPNPMEKRNLRKKVAVINTIIRENELKK